MSPWHLPLEILAWSAALVGLHAMRARLGLAPIYLVTGIFLAFLAIQGPLDIHAAAPFQLAVPYTVVHLALVLTAMTLVYALDGTAAARAFIGAVVAGNLTLLGAKFALAAHLHALDLAVAGREAWAHPNFYGGIVSTLALGLDGVAIVILYQWAANRGLPRFIALFLALVAAMGVDGVVFGALYGSLSWSDLRESLFANLGAGLTAALPAGTWISAQYRYNAGGVARSSRGAFDLVDLRSELSRTRAALAAKTAEVEHVREVFSRYVSPDVVQDVLSDVGKLERGGTQRVVTILFLDIRGYSTLSEAMQPTEIIGLLNEFFEVMAKVIHRERGTILEFEGDAILAVFNAPGNVEDHADAALRASLGMLEAVEHLNAHWEQTGTSRFWKSVGISSFRVRIGVHSGLTVVGLVGSEDRVKYAVIGDAVNLASRVETLNKALGTALLLTRATRDQLLHPPALVAKGSHWVKGRKEPVEVFSVQGAEQIEGGQTGAFEAAPPR